MLLAMSCDMRSLRGASGLADAAGREEGLAFFSPPAPPAMPSRNPPPPPIFGRAAAPPPPPPPPGAGALGVSRYFGVEAEWSVSDVSVT